MWRSCLARVLVWFVALAGLCGVMSTTAVSAGTLTASPPTCRHPTLVLSAMPLELYPLLQQASFDPAATQDWCEVVKDIVAMANSGGGYVVFGVNDDGNFGPATETAVREKQAAAGVVVDGIVGPHTWEVLGAK